MQDPLVLVCPPLAQCPLQAVAFTMPPLNAVETPRNWLAPHGLAVPATPARVPAQPAVQAV